jgi:hypothetical protein
MVTRMMTKVKKLMQTPLQMTLLRDVNSLPVRYCHQHVSTTTTKHWLYQSYKGTSTTYCCSVDDVVTP